MKRVLFKAVFAVIILLAAPTGAWTQEQQKSDIFSVTPAFSFAWYPFARIEEQQTVTDINLYNFGMSFLFGIKLFNKVETQFNLTVDDPAFKNLINLAGYISAFDFLVKYDLHIFSGTVTWETDNPNPVPSDNYSFRNRWNTISLMYQINKSVTFLGGFLFGIGIGYTNFEMPVEYHIFTNSDLTNCGFGLYKGNAWGITFFFDTLAYSMEKSPEERNILGTIITSQILGIGYIFSALGFEGWAYTDLFIGVINKGETDQDAISWMINANNGNSVNGDINKSSFVKWSYVIGFQKVWYLKKDIRIGLAAGLGGLLETFSAKGNDIALEYFMSNMGPVVRLSIRL